MCSLHPARTKFSAAGMRLAPAAVDDDDDDAECQCAFGRDASMPASAPNTERHRCRTARRGACCSSGRCSKRGESWPRSRGRTAQTGGAQCPVNPVNARVTRRSPTRASRGTSPRQCTPPVVISLLDRSGARHLSAPRFGYGPARSFDCVHERRRHASKRNLKNEGGVAIQAAPLDSLGLPRCRALRPREWTAGELLGILNARNDVKCAGRNRPFRFSSARTRALLLFCRPAAPTAPAS
jgi:hypothetical protein